MKRATQDNRGAMMVEAMLALLVFFVFTIGLINLAFMGFTSFTLQYSLSKAIRWGILGSTGTYATRYEAIEAAVKTEIASHGLDPSTVQVHVCPSLNPTCSGTDAGGAGQYILISAKKPAMHYFGVGDFFVQATVLARNEDF